MKYIKETISPSSTRCAEGNWKRVDYNTEKVFQKQPKNKTDIT